MSKSKRAQLGTVGAIGGSALVALVAAVALVGRWESQVTTAVATGPDSVAVVCSRSAGIAVAGVQLLLKESVGPGGGCPGAEPLPWLSQLLEQCQQQGNARYSCPDNALVAQIWLDQGKKNPLE